MPPLPADRRPSRSNSCSTTTAPTAPSASPARPRASSSGSIASRPRAGFHLDEVWVLFPSGANMAVGRRRPDRDLRGPRRRSDERRDAASQSFDTTIQVADGNTFSIYPLPGSLVIPAGSELLVGVVPRFIVSGVTPPTTPAALDTTTSQARSWLAVWSADPPDPPMLVPLPDQTLRAGRRLRPRRRQLDDPRLRHRARRDRDSDARRLRARRAGARAARRRRLSCCADAAARRALLALPLSPRARRAGRRGDDRHLHHQPGALSTDPPGRQHLGHRRRRHHRHPARPGGRISCSVPARRRPASPAGDLELLGHRHDSGLARRGAALLGRRHQSHRCSIRSASPTSTSPPATPPASGSSSSRRPSVTEIEITVYDDGDRTSRAWRAVLPAIAAPTGDPDSVRGVPRRGRRRRRLRRASARSR